MAESILILPDTLPADDFRRLRVLLRYGRAIVEEDTSGRVAALNAGPRRKSSSRPMTDAVHSPIASVNADAGSTSIRTLAAPASALTRIG